MPKKVTLEANKLRLIAPPETPTAAAFDWRTAEARPLSKESRTYANVLGRLLSQENEYVLIKGEEVVGTYATRELAVSFAIDRFGADPVLIKRIAAIEPILEVGHVDF